MRRVVRARFGCLLAAVTLAGSIAGAGGNGDGGGERPGPSSYTTYTLSGRVAAGAPSFDPIAGAMVTIGDGPNAGRSAVTDSTGSYTLSGLEPSGFTVTASATGFASDSRGVTLVRDLTLDFELTELPLTVTERASRHRFPRLANQIQGYVPEDALLLAMSDWDLLIVDAELTANDRARALGSRGTLRRTNPDLVILAYFSAADVIPRNTAPVNARFIEGLQDGWFMKDAAGRRVRLFDLGDGNWTEMLNLTTGVNDYLPGYLNEKVLSTRLVDGIFYDWINDNIAWLNHREPSPSGLLDIDNDAQADGDTRLNELWIAGTRAMLDHSRRVFPEGSVIVGNGGWVTGDVYDTRLNGMMVEQFLEGEAAGGEPFAWSAVMRSHYWHSANAQPPQFAFIMANRDGPGDFAFVRFALASALLTDGYFCFTNRSGAYGSDWWYDEYAVDLETGRAERRAEYKGYLGTPSGVAYNAADPRERLPDWLGTGGTGAEQRVWRRDFTNGIVLVNPTARAVSLRFETAYRKIRGTIDPGFNDGQTLTGIMLPARGGAILLNLAP